MCECSESVIVVRLTADPMTFLCAMKITEDVRKYAAEQGISENKALEKRLKEKSAEVVEKRAEPYGKA